MLKVEVRGSWSKASPGQKLKTLCEKVTKSKKAGVWLQCKAPSSNPRTAKGKTI
jgi:hypothetical protein